MDPTTTSVLISSIGKASTKAAELGKVFLSQLDQEESRIRLFFEKLYQKPLSWIFTLLFAPLIMVSVILKIMKEVAAEAGVITKLKLFVLLFGLCIAGFAAWFAGGYLGTVSGFFFIKNLFGYITAFGFLLGTTFSVAFTIVFQILVFNLMCFFFLKIGKDSVIQSVCKEFLTEE